MGQAADPAAAEHQREWSAKGHLLILLAASGRGDLRRHGRWIGPRRLDAQANPDTSETVLTH
jgi:hypothetical protein